MCLIFVVVKSRGVLDDNLHRHEDVAVGGIYLGSLIDGMTKSIKHP